MSSTPVAASPQLGSHTPTASTSTSSASFGISKPKVGIVPPKIKGGIFVNDGSFLEKFKILKQDEQEKKKQEDALSRKRAADDRFKNRGKAPALVDSGAQSPVSTVADSPMPAENDAKRRKANEPDTKEDSAYAKEVRKLTARSLKGEGAGIRPLVK